MRVITRPALKRVAVLSFVLVLVVAGCSWKMVRMPLKSFRGPLPELTTAQMGLRDELRQHVEKLAGEIGERNVFEPGELAAAVDYIETVLSTSGHRVKRGTFEAGGELCHNLAVEIPGTWKPGEIVLVGAHYDSVSGSPGADDNASGAAALLAMARYAGLQKPAPTQRLLAFVNEEPPTLAGIARSGPT